MKKFIEKYFTLIVFILTLFSFFNTCSVNRRIDDINAQVKAIKDSTYTKEELDIQLQIEGLKAEKRMIQATDRKMLDVNRQTEIDKEIKELSEKSK